MDSMRIYVRQNTLGKECSFILILTQFMVQAVLIFVIGMEAAGATVITYLSEDRLVRTYASAREDIYSPYPYTDSDIAYPATPFDSTPIIARSSISAPFSNIEIGAEQSVVFGSEGFSGTGSIRSEHFSSSFDSEHYMQATNGLVVSFALTETSLFNLSGHVRIGGGYQYLDQWGDTPAWSDHHNAPVWVDLMAASVDLRVRSSSDSLFSYNEILNGGWLNDEFPSVWMYDCTDPPNWTVQHCLTEYSIMLEPGEYTLAIGMTSQYFMVHSGYQEIVGSMQFNATFSDQSYEDIPEPASIALMGLGLAGLGFMRKYKA